MLANIGIIGITQVSTTALIAGFFAYLYSVKKQNYLLAWTGGWCLLALHMLTLVLDAARALPVHLSHSTNGSWRSRCWCF